MAHRDADYSSIAAATNLQVVDLRYARPRPMRTSFTALVLLLLVALVGCGDDEGIVDYGPANPAGDSDQGRLAEAREQWADAGIADYDWSYDRSCFCPGLGFDLEVRDGTGTDFKARETSSGALPADDEETGRPLGFSLDPDVDTFDDEYGIRVTSFAERA